LKGFGAALVNLIWHKGPSKMNPHYCNDCEVFAQEHLGGAEVELALLFADVRGSTGMAEELETPIFRELIDRFYNTSSRVLINSDALIEILKGDEVTGLYFPAFAGPDYPRIAIQAGQKMLQVTGHGSKDPPWIPVGVGVHSGTAFVGAVGSKDGLIEITALGDAANVAARLAANAGAGELVVSAEAVKASGIDTNGLMQRTLSLKGREEPIDVWIFNAV
jgi:adenylate cyclase